MDENVSMALRGMMSYMSGLQGLKQFKELQECVYGICNKYDINIDDPIFSFENTDRLYNDIILNKNLNNLHRFIENEQIVSIKMTSFNWDDDSLIKEYIIHPYHLKEYNNRWYLMDIVRMMKGKTRPAARRPNEATIVERDGEQRTDRRRGLFKIFDDRTGVGDGPDCQSRDQSPLNSVTAILMSKWHAPLSARTGELRSDAICWGSLVNNCWFHQQLRSYGDEIEVMEPQTLRDSIGEEHHEDENEWRNGMEWTWMDGLDSHGWNGKWRAAFVSRKSKATATWWMWISRMASTANRFWQNFAHCIQSVGKRAMTCISTWRMVSDTCLCSYWC